MSKFCEKCGKQVGFFSQIPLELSDKILCYKCSELIRDDITALYRSYSIDDFNQTKEIVVQKSMETYDEKIYNLIIELINNILRESEYIDNSLKESAYINSPSFHKIENGIIYDIDGARGRHLKVYEDKVVITTKANVASFLTGNATDGEKTIYYIDCIGVQFKPSGATLGYLQLETAAGQMNNKLSNFFNENTFTYDETKILNEKMSEIVDYIKQQVATYKNQNTQPIQPSSTIEEIKQYKELLDLGILTQEEFDAKKKQLLGL